MRRFIIVAVALFLSFYGCGGDNPVEDSGIQTQTDDLISPTIIFPQVLSIDVRQGEQISEFRPITVKFNKEMVYVDIRVDGAEGIVALNGDIAIWTPSLKTVSPGSHLVHIMGIDKSGQQLVGFEPIVLINNPFIINPWEVISKAAIADLWFPGNIGSKWTYEEAGEKMVFSTSIVELNGKSYKAVLNSLFPGEISGLPLYVFREMDSKIFGYAEKDKKQTEEALEDLLKQSLIFGKNHAPLIEAGFSENDIQNVQVKHESMDEWLILDKNNLIPGGHWLVTKTHTSGWIKGHKVGDRIQGIRASVVGVGFAKEFGISNQAFCNLPIAYVEYKVVDEDLQGNPMNSYFLFGTCVSPDVGMVSFIGKGWKTELLEYNIEK